MHFTTDFTLSRFLVNDFVHEFNGLYRTPLVFARIQRHLLRPHHIFLQHTFSDLTAISFTSSYTALGNICYYFTTTVQHFLYFALLQLYFRHPYPIIAYLYLSSHITLCVD